MNVHRLNQLLDPDGFDQAVWDFMKDHNVTRKDAYYIVNEEYMNMRDGRERYSEYQSFVQMSNRRRRRRFLRRRGH